jgi:2-polyprenyl-3-methyl-5-hydroxy-6-metoxy-1,4-benzoquinol methylase
MFYRALPESRVKQAGEHRPAYSLKQFKYNSHYWILHFLSKATKPSRILDIGAAEGYLGALFKQQGHYVVGVESDLRLVEQARAHYDALHTVDVENFDFPYRGEFDYILLADVLEHLRNPVEILRRVSQCLRPSGQLIISLPNVAHVFVRLSLMFGRFEYQDRGILDRTHLRFFTLASLREMMDQASCRILEMQPTPAPVQLVLPWSDKPIFDPVHDLHFFSVKLCKTLLAYQFVLRAVPEERERL